MASQAIQAKCVNGVLVVSGDAWGVGSWSHNLASEIQLGARGEENECYSECHDAGAVYCWYQ